MGGIEKDPDCKAVRKVHSPAEIQPRSSPAGKFKFLQNLDPRSFVKICVYYVGLADYEQ